MIRSLLFFVLLIFSMAGYPSAIIGFNVTIEEIPVLREDGSEMSKTEIKAFRVFKVGDLGLEALEPDIEYNQEDTAEGGVFMSTDIPEGNADLCVMTVDTFDRQSTICSDVTSVPFVVPPPVAPSSATFTQTVTFNITIK